MFMAGGFLYRCVASRDASGLVLRMKTIPDEGSKLVLCWLCLITIVVGDGVFVKRNGFRRIYFRNLPN